MIKWWLEGAHQIVSKILLILLSTSILFLSFILCVSLMSSQNLIVFRKYLYLDRCKYDSHLIIIIIRVIHFLIIRSKSASDLSNTYMTSHFLLILSIPHKLYCLTFPLPYFLKLNML